MAIHFQKEKHSSKEIFSSLHPLLGKWFRKEFGSFTEPQLYSIMNIHNGGNTLISAPTGTGKTLSAFTAILNELVFLSDAEQLEDRVYCVYISPLRALSNDIEKNLEIPLKEINRLAEKEGKKINIRVSVRTGDTKQSERSKMLKKPPHILITTPESFAILLTSPKFSENFKKLKWLIIDEIHSLASNKRGTYLSLSMERLQLLNPDFSRIGLSATISPLEDVAKFLVGMKNEKESRDCSVVDVQFIKKLDLQVKSPLPDLVNVSQEQIQNALYSSLHDLIQKHRTTLIFTNTRAATERVVHSLKEKYPGKYPEKSIGAHHSSVSRTQRLQIENSLKEGKLKCVVCSTSLELGIDIGYIDLVVLLGSPKSIARALQRVGRSGHRFHDTIKGRIVVLDRDDLVECCVLVKNARESKIDKIHIPENCLDVLAQHIYGVAISNKISDSDLFSMIKSSFPFRNLERIDFEKVLEYLSGEFASLETRHVYAKIWWDREEGLIGKRGKLARVIYMTNIGTIPDESRVKVKIGDHTIGYLDEAFMDRMKKGDVFVLGGKKYVFRYSRGMTIQVGAAEKRPPTVPNWVSEMLPLSFDLAMEIQRFRSLMAERFSSSKNSKEIIKFVRDFLGVDEQTASAVYSYFMEQYRFSEIPDSRKLLVEQVKDEQDNHFIFHSLFGRRVNDALSRAFAYVIAKLTRRNANLSINDNGFIISVDASIPFDKVVRVIKREDIEEILRLAIDDSEVLRRRFRHCASRSLMILRNYKGRVKSVARQNMASRLLLSAVKRIEADAGFEFPILKEARREVMEDAMDLDNARKVIEGIRSGKIKIEQSIIPFPSPFAFNLFAVGRADLVKMESRVEFIKRMHQNVILKISMSD